jgi:hypothetical protein
MKNAAAGMKNLKAVKEIQKIIAQVRSAQAQLRELVKDKKAIAQAKQYTERFRKDFKKRLSDDIARIGIFLAISGIPHSSLKENKPFHRDKRLVS